MKGRSRVLLTLLMIGVAMAAIYFLIYYRPQKTTTEPESNDSPVATVRVAPIRKGTITQYVDTYGSIVPIPQANQTIALPFETRILRIPVFEGQRVSGGESLVEISPTPDALLQLEEARNNYTATKQSFENTQKRVDLKIATIDQLVDAKQNYEQARLRLDSLEKRGVHGPRSITAETDGVVAKIHIQSGATVAAGAPILSFVAKNQLEARLGIQSENASRIHTGQPISIISVNTPSLPMVTGRIREISRTVNPTTRLIDVFVFLPQGAGFYSGESVQGRITVASAVGLIAPHAAVLPEGSRYVLFTIKNGHAGKRFVQIGIQNERETQVIDKTLLPGELAVILGNYELKDGMPVRVERPR